MRVAIVTGASGFIGSHLVERLAASDFRVVALVRPNSGKGIGKLSALPADVLSRLDIRFCDIQDPEDLEAALEPSAVVFHLAAQIDVAYSARAPSLFLQTNVLGTHNLLRAALEKRAARAVVISTSEVYGGAEAGLIDESYPLRARSPYAASKIAAEKLAESYYHSYDLGVVIVRPFNTFGPRQSERAVIPWLLRQALGGGDIALGNLSPVRDFVYVSDTVAGIIAAGVAEHVEGQVFNLATGIGRSIGGLVEEVGTLVGRTLTVKEGGGLVRRASGEVWRLVGDAGKAQSQLGWSPEVTFEEGLKAVAHSLAGGASPSRP